MLNDSKVEANIPASDLKRAREFYADKLGLTPSQEFGEEALAYRTAGGTAFNVYRTEYAGKAGHTIAQWHVTDIDSEVRDLKAKGVTFEVYGTCRASSGTARSPRSRAWAVPPGSRTARATSCAWTRRRPPAEPGRTEPGVRRSE